MGSIYKADAVWHSFKPLDFSTMALGGRLDHPSRVRFYSWLTQQARQSAPILTWCDVGVLSLVDYLNVRRRFDPSLSAKIAYVGMEISEAIAAVACEQLVRPEDRILVGDVDDPQLPVSVQDRFDVISMRHVLNHCRYYEIPLRNAFDLLNPGGKVFVTLHVKCSDDRDILEEKTLPGVAGTYLENVYEFRKFLGYFSSLFAIESIVEIDSRLDGRDKPNQIFIGVKPGCPQRARPEVITIAPSRARRWMRTLKAALGGRRGAEQEVSGQESSEVRSACEPR